MSFPHSDDHATSDHGAATLPRRRLLQAGGAAGAGLWLVGTASGPAAAATPEDFAGVRSRWREMLIGDDTLDPELPEVRAVITGIDSAVERQLAALDRSADRTHLWPDLDFTGKDDDRSIDLAKSYERLRQLAQAYVIPGAARQGDAEVMEVTLAGLDWMLQHKYRQEFPQIGNWYNWEIAVPQALLPTALLLLDQLGPDRLAANLRAVDFRTPEPSMLGANLIWTSQIVAQRAALAEDDAKLALARDAIPGALTIVTEGDGFYRDGSFLQHKHHPYTGGYGRALLKAMSRMLSLLAGSPWALGGSGLENLLSWVTEGFEPWLHKGAMLAGVRGREIARWSQTDRDAGQVGVLSLMWLAHSADAERARHLRGIVKHTIEEDQIGNLYDTTELSSIVEVARIANDPDIVPVVPAIRTKQYPMMDRTVHRRPGFVAALSLSSSRIYNYESINNENLRGWHTGSGMFYLYNDDQAHYDDGYWATVDHGRLPGTTVPVGPRGPASGANYLSEYAWAGGVALGSHGVSGLQFRTHAASDQDAAPAGRKSWFLFEDKIIALGACLRSSSGQVLESIAENRRVLDPAQRFVVNGADQGGAGWDQTLDAGCWAHLAGKADSAGIGYVFGDALAVRAKRENRTGSWSDVNQNASYGDDRPLTREYLTLWFDHGTDPTDASYAYTLLPGATVEQVAAYAKRPEAEILINTRQAQAVRSGGTLGLNVWERGAPKINGVGCDRPASVLIVQDRSFVSVEIADPTHSATEPITLTLPYPIGEVVSADERITVRRSRPGAILIIDPAGSRGVTIGAEFLRVR